MNLKRKMRWAACAAAIGVGANGARADDFANFFNSISKAAKQALDEQRRKQQSGTPQGNDVGNASTPSSVTGPSDQDAPALPAAFNRVGRNVDTPQNLAVLKARVTERIDGADLLRANEIELLQSCKAEMKPFAAYEIVMGTGYDELKAKCEVEAREAMKSFYTRRGVAFNEQKAAQVNAQAKAEVERQKREDEEVAKAVNELRTGKRQPDNCPQWMTVKGHDVKQLAAPVTEVAYQPPQGIGGFMGRVEQIDGDTMLLSDQPIIRFRGQAQGYMVINIDKHAKVFNGSRIKVGSVIEGYATQSGSRNLHMTSGAAKPAPILLVTCVHVLI
ncbi:MAG: hypothetical protein JWQ07_1253 [Ramlibacter sp.]|nr:hypothetical protein [Ramlibacter sp.]